MAGSFVLGLFLPFKKTAKIVSVGNFPIKENSHLRFVVQSFLISYENPLLTFAYLQKRNIHE